MHRLIDHLSADEYWFSGTFSTPDSAGSPKPLELTGTFLDNKGLLLFEGTYRVAARTTSHPFSVRVLSYQAHAAMVEVSSSHTGVLTGHIYSLGQAYELLATSVNGTAVCCQLELAPDQAIRAIGAVHTQDHSFGFVATGSPGEDRGSLGNVVNILGGRRA